MSALEETAPIWRVALATGDTEATARDILGSLPEWFGRPDALDAYALAAGSLPTLVAYAADGQAAGFLSFERRTPVAADIHVMAVRPEHHARGCGRQLIARTVERVRAEGVRWLTVKTLAASHPDPHYARTRRFYDAVGFEPIEIFETLWGEDTPCLLMLKPLS